LDTVFGSGGEQAAVTQEYSTLAAGNMSTAVDELQSAETRLDQQETQLQDTEAQAQAALDQITAARSEAESTSASEEATLHSLDGKIAAAQQAPQAPKFSAASFANPPPNGAAGVAIRAAESQIGVPYQWGDEDPGVGFDCSGLTQWSYRQAGVGLPRTANDQYDATARVPLADMEPGDLVFWGSGGYAQHVGIYVGGGDVVDAPSSGQDVQIQPIWSSGLLGAGRP
jgi:cell wall-associated NlpC family hydrolase